jgi:sec-independent protein translocase protein TatB
MLEVGWSELLVIAIILIVVVGPKDLPGMMRTFGRMMGRVRTMANEFRGQFDEAMREADLDDVRKGMSDVNKYNPASTIRDAINPIRQLGQDIKSDLQKAAGPVSKPVDEGTPVSELASDPGIAPEPVKADAPTPVVHKPVASVAAPVAPAVVSEPVAETKAADKSKSAKKTAASGDDYPPPARKVVKRKAPEPHVEHNLHVATDNKGPVAKTARKSAAKVEPVAKPASKKKTAKTGDA